MGNEEQLTKPEGRQGDTVAAYAALVVVFHIAQVLAVVTWISVLSNDPGSLGWFAFHPTLNTFAVVCFTLGILTLQPTSQPRTKAVGLQRHQLVMFVGLPTILLGTLAIYVNKNLHDSAHFTTWHGIFGSLSLFWLLGQTVLGATSVWFGGAALGGGAKAKSVWKYHRYACASIPFIALSGYVLLPLVLVTVNFGGAWSNWMQGHSAYVVRLVAFTIAPLAILVALYSRVRPSKMKFF
ncbi:hypothetical protein BV25DRAFT_1800427 [Artomyces pyxidatus]|uniref:Uncharacterized protein n=1 Tax=Artomyces pyxidatus TaxID=48021 RepID=A0ACB8T8D0_9AGAM|nr:hypothetical protein BV25DRAFT_1800427 [Artomyces pyxidatus]